jgi:hypothetical protein
MSTIGTQIMTYKNPDTTLYMAEPLLMLSSRFFMLFSLTNGPLLVHEANLIAQAHSMERNQVLSAQPIDGKKQLCPTEFRSTTDEIIHYEYLMLLKHA